MKTLFKYYATTLTKNNYSQSRTCFFLCAGYSITYEKEKLAFMVL